MYINAVAGVVQSYVSCQSSHHGQCCGTAVTIVSGFLLAATATAVDKARYDQRQMF